METVNSRILAIEDSDTDFLLIERALGDQFTLSRESTLSRGLTAASENRFDLIILDLTLEDSRGIETFEKARAALPRTPILILSGNDEEEMATQAVSQGAQDYIKKSSLLHFPLGHAAKYAIERCRVEEASRKALEQYRTLLDNLPCAAFSCDAQGLITYYNQKAVEFWGRAPRLNDPRDRFSGSYKLYAADGAPLAPEQSWMARALAEKKAFHNCEIIIELPSGERRTKLVNASPLLEEDGTLLGAIAVFTDITSQRKAERELRESERFARSVVNSLPAHIAILDENGTIIAVNSAWKRFAERNQMAWANFGIGANYLLVGDAASGACRDDAKAAVDGIRAVIRGEKTDFYLEYPCVLPTEEQWFALSVTPFEGEGSRRVVVSHEDITARKTAERLAREQWGLREAVAGMERVLGVVGHELRTPLAALRAMSEYLLTDGARSTDDADRFLLAMSQEVDRMSDTVNNLLEAARLNSGRAKWNWSRIDLAETADDAIVSIKPLIDTREVEVVNHISGGARTMLGDADAIRRLLVNLLSNAKKHTAKGRIEVHGRMYRQFENEWVEISVRDTGAGIPPELLDRIGEAFALNSGVVGHNHVSGTGLGLAICKGIAKAHGGELSIESVPGKGTTVTARLRADLKAAATGDTVGGELSEAVAA